jgi:hypothetical protein
MPSYQVHLLKESNRQQFRWAPHTSGVTIAKPRDYEKGGTFEAASPYAVWLTLRGTERELRVGDLLELESGELRILKYIGFEEARWYVLEPVQPPTPPPVEVT